ncbi:MAG TPA: FixH family protein [Terriglobia bacterium]|nr:FixH family protein [Terriglobia bacterium]
MKNLFRAAALALLVQLSFLGNLGCADKSQTLPTPSHEEPEAIARTEFTERIENFFEYEPLAAGKPSQFRIHLTDLQDGSPVEQARVSLTIRHAADKSSVLEILAKVGKVTGIYVAEVAIPQPGNYDIEFHISNSRLDERLLLSDFKVE